MMVSRKYAVIICEDAEKWGTQQELGEKIQACFQKHEQEVWEYFSACYNEIPDVNKLDDYQAFILTGSHYSANDPFEWVKNLEQFIKEVFAHQQQVPNAPKLFGICFGHQIINKALGAKVIKNSGGRFVFTQVDINITNDLRAKSFYKDVFKEASNLVLFQSHSDEVVDLPCTATCVGSSSSCQNEVVIYGDNILTIQGHMEITKDQMLNNILPFLKKANVFNDHEEEEMWKSVKEKVNDRLKLNEMIKKFID